ncbi:MAG TPA: phosphatase PAP2 family protein [Elusimicrobiales bacterium]|nr:phosphatase PAP2 family protein [Elusimicrobiales bacterium]
MIKHLSRRFVFILSFIVLPPVLSAAVTEEFSSGASAGIFYGQPFAFQPQVLFAPVPAAVDYSLETKAAGNGHYLDIAALDLRAVPPAPAAGSAQDKADFETLLAWQAARTPAQCNAARAEMEHSFEVFFGKITPFVSPQPAEVGAFFKNVGEDSIAAHRYLKDVYKRDRPFLRDARIKPCIARVGGYAYPSGHAAMSRLFALILGDLAPARRKEFIARADEAALNRIIGGVHHPTDIEAGRILANELYRNLLKRPDFVSAMKDLRRFLR